MWAAKRSEASVQVHVKSSVCRCQNRVNQEVAFTACR